MTMTWALQDSSPQRKREAQRLNGPGLMMMSQVCICPLELLNFDFDTFGKEDHYNRDTSILNSGADNLGTPLIKNVGVFPIIDFKIA